MSSYTWDGMQNANPYTSYNNHEQVGVQRLDASLDGYPNRPQSGDADATASDVSSLVDALNSLSSGELLWVAEGVYDFSDVGRRQDLPSDATLAGDGATIYDPQNKNGTFNLTNDGSRITGLRFEGPEIGQTSNSGTSRAIMLRSSSQIDNCEIYGHHTSGIFVGEGGASSEPSLQPTPHIHHNVIRDNQHTDLGYGVVTYSGDPLIEFNFLNNNRHSIAGGGEDWSSYQLYNNVIGPEGLIFQAEQHAPGGGRMDVRNNEFMMVETNNGNPARAYAQRGTPAESAEIVSNWIYNPNQPGEQPDADSSAAIVQYNHDSSEWVNVSFSDNHYGDSAPSSDSIGVQPLGSDTGSGGSFSGFEGTTNAEGTVSTDVPNGDYTVSATHPETDETVEDSVTVDGADVDVPLSFTQ